MGPLCAPKGRRARPMRWVISAVVLLALASGAFAQDNSFSQDFDTLRGPQPVGPAVYTRWSGFYFGGQIGYDDGNADFSNSTSGPISYALRVTTLEQDFQPSAWPALGVANHAAPSFGGFVGYNTQWQDLVLGFELNFEHPTGTFFAPSTPIARTTPADSQGNTYAVNIASTGQISDLNYASLRARAGWIVDGNF